MRCAHVADSVFLSSKSELRRSPLNQVTVGNISKQAVIQDLELLQLALIVAKTPSANHCRKGAQEIQPEL